MRRSAGSIIAITAVLFLLFGTDIPAQAAAPAIQNVNPHQVSIGGLLIIQGTGFGTTQGSSTIAFNGTPVMIIEYWSATVIYAEVPLAATTGNVVVTVGGLKSNGWKVTIIAAPAVTSVSPSSGPIGSSVTITGTNLDPSTVGGGAGIWETFFFPAGACSDCLAVANPTGTSNTSITASVPVGATTGEVAVMWSGITGTPANFTVTGTLAPVADPGPADNQYDIVPLGSTVRLDATHSYDLHGLPLTYQWTFSSIPTGSHAVLLNPTTPLPTFVADVAGEYVAQVVVNNGTLSSNPSYFYVDTTTAATNHPIANAGPDQTVRVGSTVQLDGSGSINAAGDPLNYIWCLWYAASDTSALTYQGMANISNPTTVNPTFVAGNSGNYFAELWVGSNGGCSFATGSGPNGAQPNADFVKISTVNSQPVANAGPAQSIQVPQTVQLDGTGSTDVDGNALTYSWAIISKPTGSAATLSSSTYPRPTFNADIVGTYIVQLIVNDGTVNSLPGLSGDPIARTSTVTVTNLDVTPVANAGPAQTVAVGSIVNLDGASSSDVDGHSLSYRWALLSTPANSTASLSLSTSANPYFMADVAGKYVVQLIVNDGVVDSFPSTVEISTDNSRPVGNPGPHQTVATGSTVQLSGADSSDADGNTLNYQWAILFQPSGSHAVLSSATAIDPTFVAGTAGLYVVQLIVNDGKLNSVPATTWIKAQANQAPVVSAGQNQTITLPTNQVTLFGTASDDGLPNGTLTTSWTQVSGPGTVTFSSATTAVTDATFPLAGTYVVKLTANDSQLASSATATITVNPGLVAISLTPTMAGPNVTATSQTMTATVTQAGVLVSGAAVQFTVTGTNATSGNATTNSSGVATFSYGGTKQGTDTVQATYGGGSSNTATITWITPVKIVSTTTVLGRFFPGNVNQCSFNTLPTATPVFTQEFPTINFNPPAGTISGNTSGVGVNTRPFTNVTEDLNGNFTGTIVAQGNSQQAGVAPLDSFQAVFTGSFTVASAGNANITLFDDDGVILGIGGGATFVSGPATGGTNPGPTTPFSNLPVTWYFNEITFGGPRGFSLVVNFPAAGTYQYELDYVECSEGQLAMTMSLGTTGGSPPTGSLAITPITPASIQVGQTETLTVQATDGSGAGVPNLGVALNIDGANQQFLSGTTNSSGVVAFSYTGVNGGTDSVQAVANISGMASLSNVVNVPWGIPSGGGGGCSTFVFTPQGWIASPAIGAVVQNQVPITLASGVTLSSGTLKFFPTANPSQVTVLNANTTGTGPLTLGTIDATLLANGQYTIQLEATNSAGTCQLNEIVVSVTGDYKPGRETVSVTDLKIPMAGIPISISRTYDSLNRGTVQDFGNGWALGSNVSLSVDLLMNVTFTLDGKRETFYFTPKSAGNALFPWIVSPAYTPQPGVFGTLTSNGCSILIYTGGALVQDQAGVACFPGGSYSPTVYTYTDPAGRVYTITSAGQLQTIKDLNGNTLTFASNGITSSVGNVVVPFVRDGQGRITQITDLNQNNYTYTYDSPCGTGNLCSVSYPGVATPAQYTYSSDNSLQTRTDPNNNTWVNTYYTDPVNNGRLKTVTSPSVTGPNGPTQYVTQYSYNVATNTTTTTNPDTGVVTETDDSFGKPLTIIDPLNNKTTFTYYSNETLHTKVDPLLNPATTYTYDPNGFLTSVTDPLNHQTTWVNNQFGEVTSTTDAAQQNTIITSYDSFFNPFKATDSLSGTFGPLYTRTFDSMGNVLTQSDANGNTTQFTYDSRGNILKVVDPLNEITSFAYDAMDRVTSQTDPRGNQTVYGYDALGNLTDVTDAVGHVWRATYDLNGNKTSDIDPLGRTTSYTYDALNRLVKVTYPDQTTKQYTYDFRNNKLSETDQSGRVNQYVYYLDGHLKSITYALGTADAGTVQYTYDADGNTKTVTDDVNNQTTYSYDAAKRLSSIKDALTNVTQYGYDADNRRTSVTDANLNTTTYTPDARSRIQTVTYQDTTKDQYTYDGVGNQLTFTDQALNKTTRTYDLVNRLTSVTDALTPAGVTKYAYDPAGNLLSITDANNHVTSFQYDTLNHKVLRSLPLGMVETVAHDAVGNVSARTDFNGKTTTYNYDTLNRLLKKTPDPSFGAPSVSFTYFPTGTRRTMADASGSTSYTYDNRNHLKTKATPQGTLNYTYDAHGNLLTILSSNANGASVTYTPDKLNRVGTVLDNRLVAQGVSSATTTYNYYPVGTIQNYTYSTNSVQTAYTYDTLNRLKTMGSTKGSTSLSSFTYTPFAAGNVHTVAEFSGRSVTYGYDNDYHLQSETITGDPGNNNGAETYTYDAVGNRKTLNSTIPSLPGSNSYTYDANDRLSTDTYDNDGNTTVSGGVTDTYDFENRMLKHGSVSMAYDGDGNRVSETVGSTTTKYLVDTLNPTGHSQVLDELVSGAVTKTYTYGLQRISENQLSGSTWTPTFYGYDGHGNVRFTTNTAGTVGNTYQFDGFGMPIASTGTITNSYLYSGERFDSNLNLYHLRARYYNMLTGRFETMDPAAGNIFDPATLHKYVYTGDNPVNWRDPSGRDIIENVSIRAWIFTQITVPSYLQAGVAGAGGAKGVVAVVSGLSLLAVELYETYECTAIDIGTPSGPSSPTPIVTVPRPPNGTIGPPQTDPCPKSHDEWPGGEGGNPLGPPRFPGVAD